jgi:predicted permease
MPRWLTQIRLILRTIFRRTLVDRELDEELADHLQREIEAGLQAGLAEEEARHAALRVVGAITKSKEECRDMRRVNFIEDLERDLRYAVRNFRRSPGFGAVTVLIVALGIGANTAIFSIVDAVVLRPLTYRDPDRLFVIHEVAPKFRNFAPLFPVNALHFREWQKQVPSFESMALLSGTATNVTGPGEPERITAAMVSPGLFSMLGIQARLGRTFTEREGQPGQARVAVLSDEYWRSRFAADPAIIGRKILLGGSPSEVIGVLPPGFRFPKLGDLYGMTMVIDRPQIWMPLVVGDGDLTPTGHYNYACIVRLRRGVSASRALSELNAAQAGIEDLLPERYELRAALVPLQDQITSRSRGGLELILAAVGAVLLTGCVNIASLLLARGNRRKREFAVRMALGAGRSRVIRQTLVENLALTTMGGAVGAVLAYGAIPVILAHAPADIPRLDEVHPNPQLLLFLIAATALSGIIAGFLPAWRSARAYPQEAMRAVSRTATMDRKSTRLLASLVGLETALSVASLIAAGLLLHSFVNLLRVDRGFDAERVVTADLNLIVGRYVPTDKRVGFVRSVLERLQVLPGVQAAGVINKLPLGGETNNSLLYSEGANVALTDRPNGSIRQVNPGYFRTMGIALRRGRLFTDADRDRGVAVLSEITAKRLWPGEDPIGKRFRIGDPSRPPFEVVGLVGDVRSITLDQVPPPTVYVPYWQQLGFGISIAVKTAKDPLAVASSIREAIHQADPDLPIGEFRTMDEIVADSVEQRRFEMDFVVLFAVAALLLASLEIYSVVSYAVSQRTNEMGIRIALGAGAGHIRRLIMGQSLAPIAIGLFGGSLGSLVLARLLKTLLFGIGPEDPATVVGVIVILTIVAAAAAYMPARRATQVDPAVALREE